jgi:serine/threonine protein kinase
MNSYFKKYLKYKQKYQELSQTAGMLAIQSSDIREKRLFQQKKERDRDRYNLRKFLPNKTNHLLELSPQNIKTCNIQSKDYVIFKLPKIQMKYNVIDGNTHMNIEQLEFITPDTTILKLIGEGSNGKVYSIMHKSNLYTIKLPTSIIKELQEIKLYNKISNSECINYINYEIFDIILNETSSKRIYGIIMPHASGNLKSILEIFKYNNELCKKVLLIIGNIINCFFKNRLIYLDIKPENILYICFHNNIFIYLGDIGSCVNLDTVKEDSFSPPSTYFFTIASINWPEIKSSNPELLSKILAYILVLLYLNLYDYEKYKHFFIFKPSEPINFYKFFENFNIKLKSETDIIFNYFFDIFKDYKFDSKNSNELFLKYFYNLDQLLINLTL